MYLERNTDLGKFSHGNFDFNFDPNEPSVTIVVRVKYKLQKGISSEEAARFKERLQKAVNEFAHNRAELIPKDRNGPRIPIRVILQENNSSYHKVVDLEKVRKWPFERPWVGKDMNFGLNNGIVTLAHEFYHVLGNYDEYDGGVLENSGWWHDNRYFSDQRKSLMGNGTELRERYFDHIARKVSNLTGREYLPALVQPSSNTSNYSQPVRARAIDTHPKIRTHLKFGDRGNDVVNLQKSLNSYFDSGLKVDGIFGPKTRSAIRRLQHQFGLKEDGIVGPRTLGVFGKKATLIESGMKGNTVRDIQKTLNTRFGAGLKVDGIFGPKTKSAVQKIQRLYGLKANGIFNYNTNLAIAKEPSIIKSGMRGSYVRDVQQRLNASMGFGLKEDSIFGAKTRESVRSVQRLYGLKQDGIFGPKTKTAMNSHVPQTMRSGLKGGSVKELQGLLNRKGYSLAVDGIFGTKTKNAVMDFQRKNGLIADGIVGPKTWKIMLSGNRVRQ